MLQIIINLEHLLVMIYNNIRK